MSIFENFENYFNKNDVKRDSAQEQMNDLLKNKQVHTEARHAIYQEFETLQTNIARLNSEIDELIPQQNKAGVSVAIAQKHGELGMYEDRLEDFIKKYPKMTEMEYSMIDTIRQKLDEKKKILASLQNTEIEGVNSIARRN
jgi:flagellar biosynthesis chaperone FliJ